MAKVMSTRYARSLFRMLPGDCDAEKVISGAGLTVEELENEESISVEAYSALFCAIVRYLQPILHGEEAKNLFDKQAQAGTNPMELVGAFPSGYSQVRVIPQRTIGLTASYNFSL